MPGVCVCVSVHFEANVVLCERSLSLARPAPMYTLKNDIQFTK